MFIKQRFFEKQGKNKKSQHAACLISYSLEKANLWVRMFLFKAVV